MKRATGILFTGGLFRVLVVLSISTISKVYRPILLPGRPSLHQAILIPHLHARRIMPK